MDCYYHTKQPLTNFCSNPLCSLPLCPKCINLHLSQSNLSHDLVPIAEAFSSSLEQLETATRALEHEVQSIVSINSRSEWSMIRITCSKITLRC
jgi:hypothetical protein